MYHNYIIIGDNVGFEEYICVIFSPYVEKIGKNTLSIMYTTNSMNFCDTKNAVRF